MNLELIKEIVNGDDDSSRKEDGILKVLSEDSSVIPSLLKMLDFERRENKSLINDSNFELSRALVTLVEPDVKKTIGEFVVGKIKAHFHKWENKIHCCFKFNDLP